MADVAHDYVRRCQRMTREEAEGLVRFLTALPPGAGFLITRCMEPVGSPPMHGSCSATIIILGVFMIFCALYLHFVRFG